MSKWIKCTDDTHLEDIPPDKAVVYAKCDWSPYTIENNNGSPDYYTSTDGATEWYESIIAYMVIDDYIPDEEDKNYIEDLIISNDCRSEDNDDT